MWHSLTSLNLHGIPLAIWILWCVLALALLILFIILPIITLLRRHAAPERRVQVTVLTTERRSAVHISGLWLNVLSIFDRLLNLGRWRYSDYDALFGDNVYDDIDKFAYSLIVETTDTHQQMEFKITEDDCGRFQPDDEGLLTYRYDRLLNFTPLSSTPTTDTPEPTPAPAPKPAPLPIPEPNMNEMGEWDWTHDQQHEK
jgi:hypothetical protein